ncbi:MAG: ATP-binding protein [Microbacteriaceae bacterium]
MRMPQNNPESIGPYEPPNTPAQNLNEATPTLSPRTPDTLNNRYPTPRRTPRTWPLTSRLVAVVTSLVILATLLIGAITLYSLKETMQRQLDEQLLTATGLTSLRIDNPTLGIDPGSGFIAIPGLSTGTLAVIMYQNQLVRGEMISPDGASIPVSGSTMNTLISVDPGAPPVSVYLADGLGSYRLVAHELSSGSVIVMGLPLKELNTTLRHQQSYVLLVAIVVSTLSALLGFAFIRWNLRPLKRVAQAAKTISELKLDKGEVDLQIYLPQVDVSPQNEVGQVGYAFRLMLENIRNAFAARQASEQQVRDFVADASHELRTPLASIRGYAELTRLQDPNLNDDVRHSIERITKEAERMTNLVEDMLLLASLDANRPLARDSVDLSRLMIDTLSDAQAAGPNHEWVLELPEDGIEILGDESKLHQMLANLFANARIHTPEGTQITARLALVNNSAEIEISDLGPGIPQQLQQKMFQRFMRGDASRSRKTGSTGLGLAIVQAIILAHQGTLELESHPGLTRFKITLPLS